MGLAVGGLLAIKVDGNVYNAVGNFTFNQGLRQRAAMMGATGPDGYTSTPSTPFIAGEIRDASDVDLEALANITDATVTLALANGKTLVLANAWYAGEATGNSEQSNFPVRFESQKPGTWI